MKRKIWFLAAVVVILILAGVVLWWRTGQTTAGLVIETQPQASVFLDNVQVGTTPLTLKHKPGDVVVKLVPFSQANGLTPYETTINLVSGIETVLRRWFGPTEETSSGEIMSFEKIGGKTASLSVVSVPDTLQIQVDGKNEGFTPKKIDPAQVGDHIIKLSATNYQEREIKAQTVTGYRLTVIAKLAKLLGEDSSTVTKVEEPDIKEIKVEILQTPTGFLRVRSAPSTAATESARVQPGKSYPFIEQDPSKTWYKIEYADGKSGWVSSQYAKKVAE